MPIDEHGVYIVRFEVEDGQPLYKFGSTGNVAIRLSSLQEIYDRCDLVKFIALGQDLEHKQQSLNVEKAFQRFIHPQRVKITVKGVDRREVFRVSDTFTLHEAISGLERCARDCRDVRTNLTAGLYHGIMKKRNVSV